MVKMWQLVLPEPEVVRSISSCTPSCVLTNRWPLPCRVVSAMDRKSIQRPNLLPVRYLVRVMLGRPRETPARVCSVRVEVTGEFIPHVSATDALVVDSVGDTVDCDLHFGDVGVEIAFGVPGACRVGVDEQQEDALERPALWVYPKVNPAVAVPCNGNHPFAYDEVVGELFAAFVSAGGLVGQTLAPDRLVLQLDVFQLIHELVCVRASDHLGSGSEG